MPYWEIPPRNIDNPAKMMHNGCIRQSSLARVWESAINQAHRGVKIDFARTSFWRRVSHGDRFGTPAGRRVRGEREFRDSVTSSDGDTARPEVRPTAIA